MDSRSLCSMWSAVAEHWREHADYVDARGAVTTAAMLDAIRPGPGDRVLELACGPGSVGLAAAPLVAPDGEVVLSDGVAEMTSIAAARAAALGLTNVSTQVLDLAAIDQPDAAYDVVVCRDGLMFAPDPGQAVGEIRRVLRPGGRVAVAVWGPRDRNPWLGLVLDAVSAELDMPFPPPGIPGPFSLDDVSALGKLFSHAGLTDVVATEIDVPLVAPSFGDWWGRTSSLAGPLAGILASLPAETLASLETRLHASARPYETPAGLTFPGLNNLVTGRAP